MPERQGNSDSYKRMWLFHGTAEHIVDKIVAVGFNRTFGFKELNPNAMTRYGKGSYFAVNSKYSVDYTGREDQPTPDVRRGTERYDSTVNNLEAPTIFVTFYDSQAYPEYLVTFMKECALMSTKLSIQE